MTEEAKYAAIIIGKNGNVERIPYEREKYYYNIYSKSEDNQVKEENEGNKSLFGSILASKLIQDGYIVLFFGSLSPKNKEYYHHYLYLPSDDLTEHQLKELYNVLDSYSLEGKINLEKINEEQKLICYRDGDIIFDISLKHRYFKPEELIELMKLTKNKSKNYVVLLNPDGSNTNDTIYINNSKEKKEREEEYVDLSQRGYIVLRFEKKLRTEESCIKLYLPIRFLKAYNEYDTMEKIMHDQEEFDFDLIKSQLLQGALSDDMLEFPMKFILYIGGDEVETREIPTKDENGVLIDREEIEKSIIEATDGADNKIKKKLDDVKNIIVDKAGRIIFGTTNQLLDRDSISIQKGISNEIIIPRATLSELQKRAFLELIKIDYYWQTNDNPEGKSLVKIDGTSQGELSHKYSSAYGFLYDIIQYQIEYYNLKEDALVVIYGSGKNKSQRYIVPDSKERTIHKNLFEKIGTVYVNGTTIGEVAEKAFFGKNTAIKLSKNGCIVLIGEGATSAKEGYNNKLLYIPKDFGNNEQREQFEILIKAFLRDNGKALKEGFTLRVFDSNGNEICALNQEEIDSNDIGLDIENGKGNKLSIIQNPNNNLYRFVIYNALGNVIYSIKKINGNIEIFKHEDKEIHKIFTSEIVYSKKNKWENSEEKRIPYIEFKFEDFNTKELYSLKRELKNRRVECIITNNAHKNAPMSYEIDDAIRMVILVLRNNGINEEYALDFIAKYVLCDLANDIQSDLMSYILKATSERQLLEREKEGKSIV